MQLVRYVHVKRYWYTIYSAVLYLEYSSRTISLSYEQVTLKYVSLYDHAYLETKLSVLIWSQW